MFPSESGATAPFVVGYSTRVLPDMGVGALAGISLLLFAYAQQKDRRVLYFLSGAFAALTIYVKLIGLAYILGFLVALIVWKLYNPGDKTKSKVGSNSLVYPFIGMLAFALSYILVMAAFSGSLFGIFLKYGANQTRISPSSLAKNSGALFTTFFGYSNGLGPVREPEIFPLGFIIFLALIGTFLGLVKKDKRIVLLSVIFLIAFLYIFFGSVTLTRYSFIFVVSRYFIMIAVPIAVLTAYSVSRIHEYSIKYLRNYSMLVPIFILLIVAVSYIPVYSTLYNYNISISGDTRTFSSMLSYVRTNSSGRNISIITIDNSTANFLDFLSGYNSTVKIEALNISNRIRATTQMSRICIPGSNSYVAIAYENYSRLQYTTVFNDWINESCSLVKLRSFNDTESAFSTYNGMNVYINLYKVNWK